MTSHNEHTGDAIRTKGAPSKAFEEGWDGIDWSVKLDDPKDLPGYQGELFDDADTN